MATRRIKNRLITAVTVQLLSTMAAGLVWPASDAGRSAADFLMIGQGARAAALGGAYTAMSSDATAAHWNPAGLSGLENAAVALGHFAWYQDITVEQLGVGLPLGEKLVGGVTATYVNYGQIDGYDINGVASGDLVAYDWVGGFSVAATLTESFSAGVTAKYVNQRLDDVSGSALAFDLGARFETSSLAFGAAIVNLGGQMKFDQSSEKLPAAARFGGMVRTFDGAIITSLDIEQRFEGDLTIRQGLELGFSDRYFLRAGYDYLPAQDGRRLATGMSLGGGLRLSIAEIDYAFTPNDKSTSEDLHRFTLTFQFAGK
ncbi:MAG: PorV/PorQ family protein [Candidatus Zixiibacteriota bacterium]